MAQAKDSTPMVNIPTNSLVLIDKKTETTTCQIRKFYSGTISLTGFAISQFMEGAEIEANDEMLTTINSKAVQLILRLAKLIPILQAEPVVRIDVKYTDLVHLRRWLELRMQHCEQECDQRTPALWNPEQQKFNPDTYIGQKLLLLDLRELMIGEII